MSREIEYVPISDAVLDDLTSAETMRMLDPRADEFFARVARMRQVNEHCAKVSNWGRSTGWSGEGFSQRVASIHPYAYDILVWSRPPEWFDGPGFWKWLQRHPEYRVGSTKRFQRTSLTTG